MENPGHSAEPRPFAAATAVRSRSRSATTECFDAEVRPGWDILGNANGGYLLTIAARAMSVHLDRPDPVTVTGHYLSPGTPGPLEAEVDEVRSGRRFSTASCTLRAGDKPLLGALGTFSDLSGATGPRKVDAAPPDLPAVEDCVDVSTRKREPGGELSFMDRVDLRLHPEDAGFSRGDPVAQSRQLALVPRDQG
ncbi:MAG: thioesterase family protein [Microthrixaceae bacterium]|nr:thioesterase family protein [Microthrixaceae bacterium]